MKNLTLPFLIASCIIIVIFIAFGSFENYSTDLLNSLSDKPFSFSAISGLILVGDIVLPVPSSVVMYLNGYVLGTGYGTLLSFVSLMISSVLGYGLGGAPRFIKLIQSKKQTSKILEKYGGIAIILTRGIPILSESICMVCGYNKMNFKNYMTFNFIGFLPICILYAYMGTIASELNAFLYALILSIVVTILFWGLGFLINKRSSS